MENNNNTTELVFVLDESGSMSHLRSDTIGGFNSVMEEQRKTGNDVLVTTVLFNHHSRTLHDRIPLKEVPLMSGNDYKPGGNTALLDALGNSIRHIEEIHKYARKEDVPVRTLFVITTDGMENASREFSSSEIKEMIEEKKKLGWEFIYLAANIDAVETAGRIGISRERAVNYPDDAAGTRMKYDAMNDAIGGFCCYAPNFDAYANGDSDSESFLKEVFGNWREKLDEENARRAAKKGDSGKGGKPQT